MEQKELTMDKLAVSLDRIMDVITKTAANETKEYTGSRIYDTAGNITSLGLHGYLRNRALQGYKNVGKTGFSKAEKKVIERIHKDESGAHPVARALTSPTVAAGIGAVDSILPSLQLERFSRGRTHTAIRPDHFNRQYYDSGYRFGQRMDKYFLRKPAVKSGFGWGKIKPAVKSRQGKFLAIGAILGGGLAGANAYMANALHARALMGRANTNVAGTGKKEQSLIRQLEKNK